MREGEGYHKPPTTPLPSLQSGHSSPPGSSVCVCVCVHARVKCKRGEGEREGASYFIGLCDLMPCNQLHCTCVSTSDTTAGVLAPSSLLLNVRRMATARNTSIITHPPISLSHTLSRQYSAGNVEAKH